MALSIKNTFFVLLVLFILHVSPANGRPSSFFIASDGSSKMKLLGEAEAVGDKITLTPVTTSPTTIAGGVFYGDPINLEDPVSGTLLPFSTSFSLQINNSNNGLAGGGAALVMCESEGQIGDAGEDLGVPIGAIAIEFYTNGNHLGINLLGTRISSEMVDLDLYNINLNSGRPLYVCIDHTGVTNQLAVYLSYGDAKPKQPVLSTEEVSLFRYLGSRMHVGLTASTQGSTETHVVGDWRINSAHVLPPPPPETTSNVPIRKQGKWDFGNPLVVTLMSLIGLLIITIGGGTAVHLCNPKSGDGSCNNSFNIFCCLKRR